MRQSLPYFTQLVVSKTLTTDSAGRSITELMSGSEHPAAFSLCISAALMDAGCVSSICFLFFSRTCCAEYKDARAHGYRRKRHHSEAIGVSTQGRGVHRCLSRRTPASCRGGKQIFV